MFDGVIPGAPGLVGRTPLVELSRLRTTDGPRVVAKLEGANPAGSAKDRPAARMLESAVATGVLRPGGTVVESSSGNLGVALAQQCGYHGFPFICVVDPRTPRQTVRLIEAYGGTVHQVERPDPRTGDWLAARISRVRELVDRVPGAWWPNQYANPENAAAHRAGAVAEIIETLGHAPAALYVATSSTGTLVGTQQYLRDHGHPTRVVAVDAQGSVLFGGTRGDRRLPGFGAGIVPPLAAEADPDEVARVDDLESVVGCRRLVRHESLLVGASAGGVVSAFLRHQSRYRKTDTVALVFHDGGERYLDTVYDDDWVADRLGVDPGRILDLVDPPPDEYVA